MEKVYDIVIIGAGPAGMTAAIYAARANMRTLLLDRLSPGGQMISTNEIENYTGLGKVSGVELAIKMFNHTRELGVEFDYRTVVDIKNGDPLKTIICEEDGTVYQARAIILATGTIPRRLGVPGENAWTGNGVSWCAICDGARYRDKQVVVIGGGNSAVEESIYLAGICAKLTIITLFDLTADPKACDRLLKMPNVTVYPYQEVIEFTGANRLAGVRFKSTREDASERHVSCDGVFEYIGFQASSEAFARLGITDHSGRIRADAHMRTSAPGIFGAGDIIVKHLRQIVTACADGALAANSAVAYIESLK